MLTGYFSIVQKEYKYKKVIQIYFTVLFYGFLSFCACIFIALYKGHGFLYVKSILLSSVLLPFSSGQWWFFTAYMFLLLMIPGLNSFLERLTKKQSCILLLGFLVYFGFIPSFFSIKFEQITTGIFYYTVGYYIKKYPIKISKWIIVLLIILLLISAGFCLTYSVNKNSFFSKIITAIVYGNLRGLIAFLLFVLFGSIKFPYNSGINIVASATFDVYIIHVSQVFKDRIFKKINLLPAMQKNYWLVSIFILAILIFIVLTFVGIIREYIFKTVRNRNIK